ncbi:DUF484 family protein [Diaphorobacter ruginosibacter]|uniref:DUF484 family protein n=1 Tax=Diaphorobacter ruginosibacter TaxID=1715720 RepID=A0A7G9RMA0_9BURK|nr:DUF484 family protein [Diaphorobacter ruginosibacter]QNN56725.1 DUF484 family protein [Diaphorobacter ruginosibacter]
MTHPHNVNPAVPPITEEDIAEFLLNTPDFFERHAEVLSSITITSPHGHRAVSLHERQAEMLREKIKGLEQRIMDMVRHSGENTAIGEKTHEWARRMLSVKEPIKLPAAVENGMRELFDVPQVALRVWGVGPVFASETFARGVSDDARAFASSLTSPFCGANMGFEPTQWLPQAAQVQSLALLPLRDGAIDSTEPAFGMLVLGSHDPARFDAAMGTEFLTRMAELASSALSRLR